MLEKSGPHPSKFIPEKEIFRDLQKYKLLYSPEPVVSAHERIAFPSLIASNLMLVPSRMAMQATY